MQKERAKLAGFFERLEATEKFARDQFLEARRKLDAVFLDFRFASQGGRQHFQLRAVPGKESVQFDIEDKIIGCLVTPSSDGAGFGEAVKGGIDFNERKAFGIPAQLLRGGKPDRIPGGNESGIGPASGSCQNFTGHKGPRE